MTVLLNKKLMKQSEFESKIAEHNFMMTRCKKCYGTKLMKKRDCDFLYGYRHLDCKLMDKFVEKATKKTNLLILGEAIKDMMSYKV